MERRLILGEWAVDPRLSVGLGAEAGEMYAQRLAEDLGAVHAEPLGPRLRRRQTGFVDTP